VRLLGYAAEHLRGRHYLDFVHPDYRRQVAHFYGQQFAARIANTYDEVLVLTREGAPIWLGQNVQLVLDGGEVVGSQVVARDVTRRRQAEQALTETNQKLTIWVSELEQRNREISMLSHMGELLQACQTVGEAYDVFSQTLMHLFPADAGAMYLLNASRDRLEAAMMWGEQAAFAPAFAPDDCWALRRGQTHTVDGASAALRCRHLGDGPGGPAMCVPMTAQAEALGLLHLRPALAANGTTREAQARQMEATQRLATTVVDQMALALSNLRLRETLRGQAIRDPLTGLFNRRYLEETLERELNRAERSQRPFGVIMLDLDHFKRFNDTFGHAAGDAVLRELGRFLEDQTRGGDIACRYGGEEFTLILPECPLDSTLRRAEQFREGVKRLEVQHRGQLLGAITISLGVANYPDHGRTGDVLLQRADAALYRAKREGRDRVIAATAR
jgi:diguanylate cyclase (GGDEF)-like protein/PAS domain S-box-containing protein